MESQPQNPESRINPENFHPCNIKRIPSINRIQSRCKCLRLQTFNKVTGKTLQVEYKHDIYCI